MLTSGGKAADVDICRPQNPAEALGRKSGRCGHLPATKSEWRSAFDGGKGRMRQAKINKSCQIWIQ